MSGVPAGTRDESGIAGSTGGSGDALRADRWRRAASGVAGAFRTSWPVLVPLVVVLVGAWTYRWVDEHGVVHYGDSIPARYSGAGHDVLDEQGRVIKRVESFSQKMQDKERRSQEDARRAAEARAALEQQRHDSALLATYDSSAEIDQARDRALAQELALIDSLQVMRKQSQSADEAAYIDAQIRLHDKNMAAIRQKYDADKARYQELTGRP